MFCFENVATKIVGKSSASLLASAADPEITPPDIAAIVSLKFTFVVTYDNESYGGQSKIFLIRSILATYGRDSLLPQIQGNVDITYPNTPMQLTAKEHKSPSTAMSNLTTNSPPHVKYNVHKYIFRLKNPFQFSLYIFFHCITSVYKKSLQLLHVGQACANVS